ncbi:MAG: hypothetical protein IJ583_08550 [Firmicutes bacterium]|nr:hypothetical protein [Bacillota bacterium]
MRVIIAILVISALINACSYGTGTNTSENTNNTVNKESGENMLAVNETNDGVLINDLMSCTALLGKTAQQAGIPESVLNGLSTDTFRTYADGNIFGVKDYGIIYLSSDICDDSQPPKVTRVWIHIKDLDYSKCREELIKLYGEPLMQGEEPYVEVNGGAVIWSEFTDNDTLIRLSCASERNYIEIDIESSKKT